MRCTTCGRENPEDAHFCANCGSALQDETTLSFTPIDAHEEMEEAAHLPSSDLEPGQGLLVVQRGPNAGSTFLIESDETTMGRDPANDIFLDDITVSRRHAGLRREGGRFVVHDQGSLNGTYVNRERVEVAELANGDELQIGKFKLLFYMGE